MSVTEEHIADAFGRLETIARVHEGVEDAFEQFEAIKAYMEYLGLDENATKELTEQVLAFVPWSLPKARGWVVMGVLIGLTAAAESAGQPI